MIGCMGLEERGQIGLVSGLGLAKISFAQSTRLNFVSTLYYLHVNL